MLLLVTPVASSARVSGTPAANRRSAVARSLARWPSHSGPFCLIAARISTWFHTLSKLDSDSGVSGRRGWPAACASWSTSAGCIVRAASVNASFRPLRSGVLLAL
ncbi:hypothetical protein D3C71_1699040 [compost metagenome]